MVAVLFIKQSWLTCLRLQENVSLMHEINALRRELKLGRNRITELEAALGLNRKHGETARELLAEVAKSKQNPQLEMQYEQAKNALAAQQAMIAQLQQKLEAQTHDVNNVNRFQGPLPPIGSRGSSSNTDI